MKKNNTKLTINRDTIRHLKLEDMKLALGGLQENTGSQQPSGATCPPPKNGEGVGCVGG